jgi:hypothetical protein
VHQPPHQNSKIKHVENSLFQSNSKHFKDKKLPAMKSPSPLPLTPRFSEVVRQNADSPAAELARSRARRAQRGPDSVIGIYRDSTASRSIRLNPSISDQIRVTFLKACPSKRFPDRHSAFDEGGWRRRVLLTNASQAWSNQIKPNQTKSNHSPPPR